MGQATKRLSVSLELNGMLVGVANEFGALTRVYILPSYALAQATGTATGHYGEEFLSGSLDLLGTTIMNREMAETGKFACVFAINGSFATTPLASD